MRSGALRIVPWLPALAAVAADMYMRPAFSTPEPMQAEWTVWRAWLIVFAITLGFTIRRFSVRLVCVVLLLAFIVAMGFSIGLLYAPALLFGLIATVLQLTQEEESAASR